MILLADALKPRLIGAGRISGRDNFFFKSLGEKTFNLGKGRAVLELKTPKSSAREVYPLSKTKSAHGQDAEQYQKSGGCQKYFFMSDYIHPVRNLPACLPAGRRGKLGESVKFDDSVIWDNCRHVGLFLTGFMGQLLVVSG